MEVRRLALVAAAFLILVPTASARILLGVLGDQSRFAGQTGQHSQVGHVFLGWNQGYTWGGKFALQFAEHTPIPMIAMTMSNGWPHPHEAITPAGLANGKGDAYLNAFNQAIAQWGRVIYVRPFPEMNGHWNSYCAYTKGGSFKGASHSTKWFRKAFARVYLLLHGGTAAQLNARLRALGLPKVMHDFAVNPYPRLRVLWNPQGYGSPTSRATARRLTTRATATSTSSGTTFTTSAARPNGRPTITSTRRTARSRTRSASGASGESTTRRSSSAWPAGSRATTACRCSRGSRASRARSSTSARSRAAAPPTGATSRPWAEL